MTSLYNILTYRNGSLYDEIMDFSKFSKADDVAKTKPSKVNTSTIEKVPSLLKCSVNDNKQTITNKFPEDIQSGNRFDFELNNRKLKIRNGIKKS